MGRSMPRSRGGGTHREVARKRGNEVKLALPAGLVQALDRYASAQGLSRDEAVRAALCSEPLVTTVMSGGGASIRDVVGP